MNGVQYEEFCRLYLARTMHLPFGEIKSLQLTNQTRMGESYLRFQIDLAWETETPVTRYLTIVEVKYRAAGMVARHTVLLLEQVRQQVGAQKAMLISNVGFNTGALKAAQHAGIALLTLVPGADLPPLHESDRDLIYHQLATHDQPIVKADHVILKSLWPRASAALPAAPRSADIGIGQAPSPAGGLGQA